MIEVDCLIESIRVDAKRALAEAVAAMQHLQNLLKDRLGLTYQIESTRFSARSALRCAKPGPRATRKGAPRGATRRGVAASRRRNPSRGVCTGALPNPEPKNVEARHTFGCVVALAAACGPFPEI
jgi:hypothetical protein